MAIFQLHVEFSKEENLIKLEGPPDEVESCRNAFKASIDELVRKFDDLIVIREVTDSH